MAVSIGQENKHENLTEASVISTSYDVADRTVARVGIVGPTRMDYPDPWQLFTQLPSIYLIFSRGAKRTGN